MIHNENENYEIHFEIDSFVKVFDTIGLHWNGMLALITL